MDDWFEEIFKAWLEFKDRWNSDPDTYDNPEQHRARPMEDPR